MRRVLLLLLLAAAAAWALPSTLSPRKIYGREIYTSADKTADDRYFLDIDEDVYAYFPGTDSLKITRVVTDTFHASSLNRVTVAPADTLQMSYLDVTRRAYIDTLYGDFGTATSPLQDTTRARNLRVVFSADGSHSTFLKGLGNLSTDTLTATGRLALTALRDTVGAIIGDSATLWSRDSTMDAVRDTVGASALAFSDGTSALPGITNLGDLNTGLYFSAADAISLTAGGAQVCRASKGATLDSFTVAASVFSVPATAYLGDAAADLMKWRGTLGDSMRVGTGDWIGLTGAAGRVQFYDATVDCLGVLNAVWSSPATNFVGTVLPKSNDGAALGKLGTAFSDLFLAAGGVISWTSGKSAIRATDTDQDVEITYNGAANINFNMNAGGYTTIDTDGTMNTGNAVLEIHNATNCSSINPAATSWTNCSSSRDWKTDIMPVDTAAVLDALRFVRPVQYRYRGNYAKSFYANPDTMHDARQWARTKAAIQADSTRQHVGFIAQDVVPLQRALNPSVVPDTTSYSLDPIVQAQQIAILHLLKRVEALEARVAKLEAR